MGEKTLKEKAQDKFDKEKEDWQIESISIRLKELSNIDKRIIQLNKEIEEIERGERANYFFTPTPTINIDNGGIKLSY